MSNGNLPEGWISAPLGDLGKWGSGGTPLRSKREYFEAGKIPWLKIGDLNDGVVTRSEESISARGLENSAARLLPPGVLLIAMYGSIGKLGITGIECATNQAIAHCRPDRSRVDLGFLFWSLRAKRDELLSEGKGGTQQNISQTVLRAFQVEIPPLAEQKRIVAKVEELLARVSVARERLARVQGILMRFRQAVLAAACDGRLTEDWRRLSPNMEPAKAWLATVIQERRLRRGRRARGWKDTDEDVSAPFEVPETWAWCAWDDLVDWVTYGFTRPMPHVKAGVPIVTAKNISGSRIDFEGADRTPAQAFRELSEKDRPRAGEILVTKDGSIGRAAIVTTREPFCVNQSVAILRFGGRTAHVPYLLRVVEAPFTQALVDEGAKGSAIRHISITAFARFPVPVPPPAEQVEVVRRIETLFNLADTIEEHVTTAAAQADKLTQSILAKAFRGELVPTEAELARRQRRRNEPADEIVGRIAGDKTRDTAVRSVPSSRTRSRSVHDRDT